MIETVNLTKKFDQFLAVDKVSLTVGEGEVLALLGPNGAGKTTTVRMLTSILRPTSGSARVAGYDIVTQPDQVRALVGVLTENHGLYNRMPAQEYLDFFGQLYGLEMQERLERTASLLKNFGLWQDRNRKIGEFSKGMRQKLALARALYHAPPVLLLDEPTSAMDPKSARLVRDAIHDLRTEHRAVIICTHNLFEAEELADRIAIINAGQILANGSPNDLKNQILGQEQYEIRLGKDLNGWKPDLPKDVHLTARGADWIRFETPCASEANPQVLQALLSQGLPVVSLHEVPRNLEQVYLKVINTAEKGPELTLSDLE